MELTKDTNYDLKVAQELLLKAYLSEQKAAQDKVSAILNKQFTNNRFMDELDERKIRALELYRTVGEKVNSEGVFYKLLYVFLRIKSRNRKKVDALKKEIDLLDKELYSQMGEADTLLKLLTQESVKGPDIIQYELAMMGNSIFKPR